MNHLNYREDSKLNPDDYMLVRIINRDVLKLKKNTRKYLNSNEYLNKPKKSKEQLLKEEDEFIDRFFTGHGFTVEKKLVKEGNESNDSLFTSYLKPIPAEIDHFSSTHYKGIKICRNFSKGYCRFGKSCKFAHYNEYYFADGRKKDPEPCGLCGCYPETYGLLENCLDAFCYSCIKNWRNSCVENHACCPSCNVISFYIIPSSWSPNYHQVRFNTIYYFRESKRYLPCPKMENFGRCSNKSYCFYDHNIFEDEKTPEEEPEEDMESEAWQKKWDAINDGCDYFKDNKDTKNETQTQTQTKSTTVKEQNPYSYASILVNNNSTKKDNITSENMIQNQIRQPVKAVDIKSLLESGNDSKNIKVSYSGVTKTNSIVHKIEKKFENVNDTNVTRSINSRPTIKSKCTNKTVSVNKSINTGNKSNTSISHTSNGFPESTKKTETLPVRPYNVWKKDIREVWKKSNQK